MTHPQQIDDFDFRRFVKNERYSGINREERHYAAVLFHLLTRPDNVKRVLDYALCHWQFNPDDYEVYFEFSYIRDLWHVMRKESNSRKRDAIIQMLEQSGGTQAFLKRLESFTDHEFNEFFIRKHKGADGNDQNRKLTKIQSPANWRLSALDSNLNNDDDMVAACKLK